MMTNEEPEILFESLTKNSFQERSHDDSKLKVGRNAISNRITHVFKQLNFDRYPFKSLDSPWINL